MDLNQAKVQNKKKVPEGYLFTRRYTNYIFVLLFLLYMFDYIDRLVVTSLFPFLKADWKLTDTQCGLLVSAVYWSIVLFTFPVSILVDRWSRKKTIGLMATIWGFATAVGAFSRSFRQLFLVRTVIGVGEAGYAPGGSALISAIYPQRKRSWMIGLWNAAIPLGSAIGVAVGGIIATKWGWRHALGLVAIPGVIIAVLFFFVKDYKTVDLVKISNKTEKAEERRKIKMGIGDLFREFFNKPSLIFTYFGMAAMVFTTTSILTWLPTYFHRVRGMAEGPAGVRASIVMLFAIVGAPLGGYLADKWMKTRINARLIVPAISSLISAGLLFLSFSIFEGEFQYMILLSFGISITVFVAAAGAVTQDVVHAGLRAISYAIAVMIQNLLGASLGPVVMGYISDKTDIETAFLVLPLALVVASVLFFAGSRFYAKDLAKVEQIKLEQEEVEATEML
jgi:MFS family permease